MDVRLQMKILNINYDNITKAAALEKAFRLLDSNRKANIFFLNADCLYKAQKDKEYCRILNSADLVLPDGIGLKLTTRFFGRQMRENCNGSDFSPLLLARAAQKGDKVFFLGGREGVADEAMRYVMKKIPGIQIVGSHPGYIENHQAVIDKINNSGADILFVAMGVPLQEKWIVRHREKIKPRLCLGVGALLDFLSGRIKRAPRILRMIHLEWAWRILMEPRRLWKRYLVNDLKVFWLVLKRKISSL